ncbi:lipopolysaccharide kinase InaA family protein [Chitinophaga horti]|uniref:Lipopolysaccharide kinase InaA family protein n=1 Tax=Chitinophaga horti TaxID=2920382 RepID=A0ABY6IX52_9BACT|nr:lipopolysaccharide kinase InaA family protein [Chitinophaga horti]UYQ90982.1 lipopolysaccharide kinase InaA family protein [Chitinophaga horti]
MSIHIEMAPQYEFLRSYIEAIPEKFNSMGIVVHKARNIIRLDMAKNIKLVIKSYQQIYLFNQFCYANLLPSKAKRAFHYAEKLINKGFVTPEPVAYIECINNGLMKESYFVCTYTDYQPLKQVTDMPIDEARQLLDTFAAFTAHLHKKDIYHKDFSVGNILYKQDETGYHFSLVDNNRMQFRHGSFADRMKNLRRLDLPLPMLAYYCQQYAKINGENELVTLTTMLNYRKKRMLSATTKVS